MSYFEEHSGPSIDKHHVYPPLAGASGTLSRRAARCECCWKPADRLWIQFILFNCDPPTPLSVHVLRIRVGLNLLYSILTPPPSPLQMCTNGYKCVQNYTKLYKCVQNVYKLYKIIQDYTICTTGGARSRSGHRSAEAALSCNNESHRPIGWLPITGSEPGAAPPAPGRHLLKGWRALTLGGARVRPRRGPRPAYCLEGFHFPL